MENKRQTLTKDDKHLSRAKDSDRCVAGDKTQYLPEQFTKNHLIWDRIGPQSSQLRLGPISGNPCNIAIMWPFGLAKVWTYLAHMTSPSSAEVTTHGNAFITQRWPLTE